MNEFPNPPVKVPEDSGGTGAAQETSQDPSPEMNALLDELHTAQISLTGELNQIKDDRERLQAKHNKEIEECTTQQVSLREELASMEADIGIRQAEWDAKKNSMKYEAERVLSDVKEQLTNIQTQLNTCETEKNTLEEKNHTAANEFKQQMAAQNKLLEQAEQRIETDRVKAEEQMAAQNKLLEKAVKAEQRITAQTELLEQAEQQRETDRVRAEERRRTDLEAKTHEYEQKMTDLMKEWDAKEKGMKDDAERVLSDVKEQLTNIQTQLNTCETEKNTLEEKNHTAANEFKQQMDAKNKLLEQAEQQRDTELAAAEQRRESELAEVEQEIKECKNIMSKLLGQLESTETFCRQKEEAHIKTLAERESKIRSLEVDVDNCYAELQRQQELNVSQSEDTSGEARGFFSY